MGLAHGELLAREGATVFLADVLDDEGERAASRLSGVGLPVQYMHLDISSPDQWQDAVSRVEAEAGRIDVLVNNAGILSDADFVAESRENLEAVTEVNQHGTFFGIAAVAPGMCARRSGSIINVSSNLAFGGWNGASAYAASKGAVRAITLNAAATYGPRGVRVNTIVPGAIETTMTPDLDDPEVVGMISRTPLGRTGKPEEVSPAVLFFASDESSFITGAELIVDGGYLAL